MNIKHYHSLIILFLFSFVFISCSKSEEYVPVVDVLPIATDDSISYGFLETLEISVLSNDTTGDTVEANTVNLIGGTDTDEPGRLIVLEWLNLYHYLLLTVFQP
jgi:hypothetical protein